jgi:phosphate transport system protein
MSPRYQERLEHDLQDIRRRVAELCATVDASVGDAICSLLKFDRGLAAHVILGDYAVNRETRAIDSLCHIFVALHLPSAGILRYISSVMRLTREVERVGDYAVGIAREAVQLTRQVPTDVARDFEMLASHSQHFLRQAMRSFNESNAELARATKETALQEHTTFDKVYGDLLSEGEKGSRSVKDLFALLFSFSRLVRISDQAKNICEETLFATTGEAKEPKVFRILFLDERNDFRSVMAEVIARKGFPGSGHYESAGWRAAERVRPEVVEFLDRHCPDISELAPSAVRTAHAELAAHHVIVSLEGDARAHLPEIPFHTAFLEWDLGPAPGNADVQLDEAQLEDTYKDLSLRIRELMTTLYGNLLD